MRRLDRPYLGMQYLRALAASMVLVSHAFDVKALPLSLLGTGVDLFFVLSGFLMVAITDHSTRPGKFLRARFYRIVPLYWLVTTTVVVMLWGGVSWRSPIPFWHAAYSMQDFPWDLIVASYAFVPWWNERAQMVHPIVPLGWTLNLEVMFYLIIGASMMLTRRLQFVALFLVIGALATAGLAKLFIRPTLAGWCNPIIIEFLIGAWIGTAWQQRKNLWLALGIAACGIFVVSAVILLQGPPNLIDLHYMLGIFYGALLILMVQLEERPNGLSRMAFPLFLGNASYAIYLVQFPVQLALRMAGVESGGLFTSSMIGLTLIVAAVLHRYIELPLMRARRQLSAATGTDPR